MHRYDDTPSGNGLVALQTCVAVIAALVSLAAVAYAFSVGPSQKDRSRIDRLEWYVTKHAKELHDLRGRVLQIERPNEPVYPPRHPGRIGGSPVIPWIEPWSGSAKPIGTEIGSGSPSIGSGGNAPLTTNH